MLSTMVLAVVAAPHGSAQQESGSGRPHVQVTAPGADDPAAVEAGGALHVAFTSNRSWSYALDVRATGSAGDWTPLAGDEATGRATDGENIAMTEVPTSVMSGDHDLRLRLSPPGTGAPDRATDVVAAGVTVTDEIVPPTTGFEDRSGDGWTTHDEEVAFLADVASLSQRMSFTEVGQSHRNRPLHLVRVGHPVPPADDDISAGESVLVIGAQHGTEHAGREMSLQLLRDLAFTDDAELVDQLAGTTVLVLPTANPDGVAAGQRQNAAGVDLNRDHLNLWEPETQAIAGVLRDFRPDISVDAHEASRSPEDPDIDTYMLVAWQRNLNVHPDIYDLNVAMIDDYVFPRLEQAGYHELDHYGSPDDGEDSPEYASQMFGLRHGLGMLTESYVNGPPLARVDVQMETALAVLELQRDRGDAIVDATARSRVDKQQQGEHQSAPVYLRGADWDTEPPPDEYVLDPPPCGYLLNTAQAEQIQRQVELFPLEVERVSDEAALVPMGQPMMTMVPDLLDERGRSNEVDGRPLDDCSDPGSQDPPDLPPPPTEPARHAVDFSDDTVGEQPDGWTGKWNASEFTVVDDPPRLRHDVQDREAGDGRQALVLDEIGDDGVVRGDVEVAALVRGSSNATVFQLGLHISGADPADANAFYVDSRREGSSSGNHVRLGRHLAGNYSNRGSAPVPFGITEDTWYEVVLQREDTYLRAKMWEQGEPEPDDWTVVSRDASFAEGRVGVMHFAAGAVVEWAFVGVGIGGKSAPRPPADVLD